MPHKNFHPQRRTCEYNECNQAHHLRKCRYCHKLFCNQHLNAKLPGMPNFQSDLPYDRHLMIEWHKPGGHACPNYYDYVEKKREFEGKKYAIALDRLIKSPPFERKPVYEPVNDEEEEEPTKFEPITEEDKKGTTAPPKNIYKNPKPFYPHKDDDKKIHRKFNLKSLLIKSAIILAIILIICIGAFLTISYQPSNIIYFNETRIVDKNVTDRVSLNVSISQYSSINDPDHSSNISVLGYLREEYTIINSESSSITKYVSDDYNNKIKLFLGLSASFSANSYFLKNSTSNKTYRVTGILKNTNTGLRIDVNSITEEERPYKIINKIIREEEVVTLNNTIKGRLNLSYGSNKIRFIFGCSEGERRYNFGCIKIVECTDGTLAPECSLNKPFQCINGNLIENATQCGCSENSTKMNDECRSVLCSDGTKEPFCSSNKPYQCINNTLIENPKKCGCQEGYRFKNNKCIKIQKCSDDTLYEDCSSTKPLYCENGKLIKKASMCGCSYGYTPDGDDCIDNAKAEAKDTLKYINDIRIQDGRSELKWNDNLYELAMYRAKDMYDRKYFDHVTPDGKCVKDFKAQFHLSDYNIAENAGAVTYGTDSTGVDYASYADSKEQVDGWMDSRGHRFNLLYPNHIYGVATCYKGACIFLGATKDLYGSGPCTTGAQGLAFWDDANMQPGEI